LGFATGENAENLKTNEAALFAKVVFFRYLLDNPVKTQEFLDMTLFDFDVFGMSDINEQLVSKKKFQSFEGWNLHMISVHSEKDVSKCAVAFFIV
jgi:hypothetical protein